MWAKNVSQFQTTFKIIHIKALKTTSLAITGPVLN